MCGIAGSLNWNFHDNLQNVELITKAQNHRGPDACNVIQNKSVILGHNRLSIIDLKKHANQPMSDVSERFIIVFNGEIYNFIEIRKTLKQKGAKFRTNSDTEVILEAWKFWQEDCVKYFNGMFAFAVWDSFNESLFLARDRMGEKPLFYSAIKNDLANGIIFASELQALCKHPDINKTISNKAISQFLSLNYILTDSCIVKGVDKLPPAHYLFLQKNKSPKLVEYWKLADSFNDKKSYKNETQAICELNDLLNDSVKKQMVSDVPLGAFLSGGLDSSSIVACMANNTSTDLIKSFSIDFDVQSYSELDKSKKVANYLNTEHFVKTVKDCSIEDLKKIITCADEPIADTSIIPMYFLSQFAKEHVTVCLSGDGGDELFAGYATNTADKLYKYASLMPNQTIQFLNFLVQKFMPTSFGKVSFDYKLKQFLKGCSYDRRRAHYSWREIFTEEEKSKLLGCSNIDILKEDPFDSFDKYHQDVKDCHFIDQTSYVDIKTWLANDILVKVDKMTMAHSLEARAPFLDYRLVEFAASLPVELKMKNFTKKYILKKSQERILPKNIIYAKKEGFNSPISHWLNGEMLEFAKDIICNSNLDSYFDNQYVNIIINEHKNRVKDNSLKIFGLMILSLFLCN